MNEPVANSCRTCGKWPSLFDLQDSLVEDEREDVRAPAPSAGFPTDSTVVEPEVIEPEIFEQEPFEAAPREPEPYEPEPYVLEDDADDDATRERSRGRRLASFIVPIAFAIYLVISVVLGDR